MIKKRSMPIAFFPLVIIIMMISSAFLYAAQVPKAENEIPVFPGAVRDVSAESEMKEQQGEEMSPEYGSSINKVYKTGASAEDVFGFYLKAIGGKEGEFDQDPAVLQPGAVSQVWYSIEFWQDQDFKDIVNDTQKSGEWIKMKQDLQKNRKPYQPGKWIKNARFEWDMKEADNDLVQFYLNIEDVTFNWGSDSASAADRKTSSRIDVQVITQKSEEALREADDEKLDQDVETLARSLKNKPPTEKDLGAPLYPGAKFDAENSAGMSAGNDYMMYLYLSDDPPSKVALFYEQKLKSKPFSPDKEHFMFALKGVLPIPDEGISVEPNTMFGGSAKTVIAIQKMAAAPE
jgi:hypothetical protein